MSVLLRLLYSPGADLKKKKMKIEKKNRILGASRLLEEKKKIARCVFTPGVLSIFFF